MLTATLDAEGVSGEVILAPGQSASYSVTTEDLAFATVYLEQSLNGGSNWQRAVDINGELVGALVGAAEAAEVTAVLRNETTGRIRYRVRLDDTATGEDEIAGEAEATLTAREDVLALLADVIEIGDSTVVVRRALVAEEAGNVLVVPEYADNATALAAGLPVGALYHTAGAVAAVVEA